MPNNHVQGKKTPTAATINRLREKRVRREGENQIKNEMKQWRLPRYPVRDTSPQAAAHLQ